MQLPPRANRPDPCDRVYPTIMPTIFMGWTTLRLFPYYLGYPMPTYCEEPVEARLRTRICAIASSRARHDYAGGVPQLELRRIDGNPFFVLGARIASNSP